MVADKEQHPVETAGLRQRHTIEEESVTGEYIKNTVSGAVLLFLMHILLISELHTDAMLSIILRGVVCPKKGR